MSDLILTEQAVPPTPAAGKADIYVDSVTKMLSMKNDAGIVSSYSQHDGWISDPFTWTYASASSFTVDGNRTAIFIFGIRLKWVQSAAVKYGIVASSSYSAGTNLTTVNIIENSNFTVLNAAITNNYYSYLDLPFAFPGRFNYAPTLTGLSGYSNALFSLSGKIMTLMFSANSINVTTTAPNFTLPTGLVPMFSLPMPLSIQVGGVWIVSAFSLYAPSSIYKTAALGAWLGTETSVSIRLSVSCLIA